MNALKPCPFCKGEFEIFAFDKKFRCDKCGATVLPDPYGRTVNTRPIEDDLNASIAILSQAVGLITTLKPTMVMDIEHPLDMAKEVAEYVTTRIADLEARAEKAEAMVEKLNSWVEKLMDVGWEVQE